ncbi:MAG: trehalose-6-phosphate synthase [Pseudomonadota bacterium]
MLRSLRYALPHFFVVLLLALVTVTVLNFSTRNWFEKDITLRGRLAIAGGREALVQHLQNGDDDAMRRLLREITRDERILSAAICKGKTGAFVATDGYPDDLHCATLAQRMQSRPEGEKTDSWEEKVQLKGGPAFISAIPLLEGNEVAGFAVLVHDLSFIDRREQRLKHILWGALAVMGMFGFLVTMAAARFSVRRWTSDIRRILRGGEQQHPEFQPILRDVRELVGRLVAETVEPEGRGGIWTPQRLRQVLTTHVRGDKIIVVANREPYIHERAPDGSVRVVHPASGLVTALEPVMRACSGVWIAHGSGTADRDVVDRHGRIRVPEDEKSYSLRRVWLTPEEEKGYYYGFANEGLWPLSHLAHARPIFRTEDWEHYRTVNRKFADAVAEEADSDDPIVLVQDYHFALVPRMIRDRMPKATIITFWHIPWPNSERIAICPWHEELLDGLLGSTILGFHTQLHCNNFLDSVDRFMEARLDREQQGVVQGRRMTLVRSYPISIEWPSHWATSARSVEKCRTEVFAELGLASDALLGIGVDRVDYTKGIEERLLAVERLLEKTPDLRGRFTFAQLGAPSRIAIPRYAELNKTIDDLTQRINDRFGQDTYRPIVMLHSHHEPPEVFRYYRAADVCYVSSLHDGMNLVAKEFVAAREDEQGVLVLSHFTGAARELPEALIVNPYDLDEASGALLAALRMSKDEQRHRMRAMRAMVAEFNVYRWAGRMLADAGKLRDRDRLFGKLSPSPRNGAGANA